MSHVLGDCPLGASGWTQRDDISNGAEDGGMCGPSVLFPHGPSLPSLCSGGSIVLSVHRSVVMAHSTVDYSKWDNFCDSDEEKEKEKQKQLEEDKKNFAANRQKVRPSHCSLSR